MRRDSSVRRLKFPFLSDEHMKPFRVLSSFKQALSNLFSSPHPPFFSSIIPFYRCAHTLKSPHFTFYHLSYDRSSEGRLFIHVLKLRKFYRQTKFFLYLRNFWYNVVKFNFPWTEKNQKLLTNYRKFLLVLGFRFYFSAQLKHMILESIFVEDE